MGRRHSHNTHSSLLSLVLLGLPLSLIPTPTSAHPFKLYPTVQVQGPDDSARNPMLQPPGPPENAHFGFVTTSKWADMPGMCGRAHALTHSVVESDIEALTGGSGELTARPSTEVGEDSDEVEVVKEDDQDDVFIVALSEAYGPWYCGMTLRFYSDVAVPVSAASVAGKKSKKEKEEKSAEKDVKKENKGRKGKRSLRKDIEDVVGKVEVKTIGGLRTDADEEDETMVAGRLGKRWDLEAGAGVVKRDVAKVPGSEELDAEDPDAHELESDETDTEDSETEVEVVETGVPDAEDAGDEAVAPVKPATVDDAEVVIPEVEVEAEVEAEAEGTEDDAAAVEPASVDDTDVAETKEVEADVQDVEVEEEEDEVEEGEVDEANYEEDATPTEPVQNFIDLRVVDMCSECGAEDVLISTEVFNLLYGADPKRGKEEPWIRFGSTWEIFSSGDEEGHQEL